jgi:hypothetical protein
MVVLVFAGAAASIGWGLMAGHHAVDNGAEIPELFVYGIQVLFGVGSVSLVS